MNDKTSESVCPICNTSLDYPSTTTASIVCTVCEKRAVDTEHNPIVVTHKIEKKPDGSLDLGVLVAFNKDRGDFNAETATINRLTTSNRFCFIDGIAVEFYEEGIFSGLIVSPRQTELLAQAEKLSKAQPCGVCKKPVRANQRYPHYVCYPCQERAVDSLHRPVITSNTGILGTGEVAYLRDIPTGETQRVLSEPANENNEIYIDGVKCTFEEARFGGIVVQVSGKERRPHNFEF